MTYIGRTPCNAKNSHHLAGKSINSARSYPTSVPPDEVIKSTNRTKAPQPTSAPATRESNIPNCKSKSYRKQIHRTPKQETSSQSSPLNLIHVTLLAIERPRQLRRSFCPAQIVCVGFVGESIVLQTAQVNFSRGKYCCRFLESQRTK